MISLSDRSAAIGQQEGVLSRITPALIERDLTIIAQAALSLDPGSADYRPTFPLSSDFNRGKDITAQLEGTFGEKAGLVAGVKVTLSPLQLDPNKAVRWLPTLDMELLSGNQWRVTNQGPSRVEILSDAVLASGEPGRWIQPSQSGIASAGEFIRARLLRFRLPGNPDIQTVTRPEEPDFHRMNLLSVDARSLELYSGAAPREPSLEARPGILQILRNAITRFSIFAKT